MTLDNSKQIEYNFYNILAIQSNLLKGIVIQVTLSTKISPIF